MGLRSRMSFAELSAAWSRSGEYLSVNDWERWGWDGKIKGGTVGCGGWELGRLKATVNRHTLTVR